ncbi:putative ribosomal protein L22/L17 [Lupinus albus]|uniref:Large ribosomal subunit protein uL22c n=1 Tax=Lupinus albus TaxID=3870 RepID=A0A6A4QK96_LUPAL|nr:putative ribosomal protein L22/L17 [Lupinus albus]
MVQWQRHVLPFILRRIGKSNKVASIYPLPSFPSSQSHFQIQNTTTHFPIYNRFPFLHHLQGISTTTHLLASSSEPEQTPISSPLAPISLLGASKGEQDQNQKPLAKKDKVQAVLKGIKQSPKKVNLVATLVRGMLVKDALMQLHLTVKRAAKTVYQVINSAKANGSHNHGLDPERLIVDEAFVGKGYFKKRVNIHGRGKCGMKVRPECRLTVVLREITPEEEAKIARLRVHNYKKLSKREQKLVPHQLIESNPIWGRKNRSSSQNLSATAS